MVQQDPKTSPMLESLSQISAAVVDVVYRVHSAVALHPFPGHVLHGGLGRQLRKVVCRDLQFDCTLCPARGWCLFPPMFGPGPAARAVPGAARPYVLSFPGGAPLFLDARDELAVRLLLMGRAAREAEFTMAALEALGQAGLGEDRVRCKVLGAAVREARLAPAGLEGGRKDALKVEFPGTLRAQVRGGQGLELSFPDVVRLALRRVVSVLTTFTDWRLERRPLTELVQAAEAVPVLRSELREVRQRRLSTSTGQSVDASGVAGAVVFGAGWQRFYPLLSAAAPLGLGKGTGLGHGEVVLRVLDSSAQDAPGKH